MVKYEVAFGVAILALFAMLFSFMAKEGSKMREIQATPHPERAEAFKEMFNSCLQRLPKGPDKTHYNDWDEVVDSCRYTANQYVDEKFGVLNTSHKEGN